MAKLKVSELTPATQVNTNDIMYIVQNNVSKQTTVATFRANTLGSPQTAKTTSYSVVSTDQDKHIYFTNSGDVILNIPNNNQISWPVGTTIQVVVQSTNSANVIVTPNTNVSLYLAGNSTPSSRTIATHGMATLLNVSANTWFISGTAIS
jgi:hypothetical protein